MLIILSVATVNEVKAVFQESSADAKREINVLMEEKVELQKKIVDLQTQFNNQMQDMIYKNRSIENMYQSTMSNLNMSKAENDSLKVIFAVLYEPDNHYR